MAAQDEIIEIIQFDELNNHIILHKIACNPTSILQVYARIESMEKFNAKTMLYNKEIINRILLDNKWPIIK